MGSKTWLYNDQSKVEFVGLIEEAARTEWKGKPSLTGPLVVSYVYYLPNPKGEPELSPHWNYSGPDTGNISKSVQDALTKAEIWRDDAQIFQSTETKLFTEDELWPRIEVEITPFLVRPKGIQFKSKPIHS